MAIAQATIHHPLTKINAGITTATTQAQAVQDLIAVIAQAQVIIIVAQAQMLELLLVELLVVLSS
jgi:hypothetical protein